MEWDDLPSTEEVMVGGIDYRSIILFTGTIIILAALLIVVLVIALDIDLNSNTLYDCENGEIIYFWSDKAEVVKVSPQNCLMIKEKYE